MIPKSNKLTKHKNNKSRKSKTQKGGAGVKADYIFSSTNISTQPNTDMNYKEVGIAHITESAAVNALKGFATGVANIFGAKGFDNSVYDKARNSALKKIINQIDEKTQKICNLRMEVVSDQQSSLIFIHLYGTLLEKRSK
jgi:hypothetical protein